MSKARRRLFARAALIAETITLLACGQGEEPTRRPPLSEPTPDVSRPDMAPPGVAPSDVSRPDVSPSNVGAPDVAVPQMPVLPLPEGAPSNAPISGVPSPDVTIPDDPVPVEPVSDVLPSLAANLRVYYDFEHPAPGDPGRELDQGSSGTDIELINGGEQMRVPDGAYAASRFSVQLGQVNPDADGNDDRKAGIFSEAGIDSLSAFAGAKGTTIMAWVNMQTDGPAANTTTPDPLDRYNAIGLVGLLSGNSDGHGVRALLELIDVGGVLRLVALGRRLDDGRSQTFAATADWRTLLPRGEWVHLAATYDFTSGAMQLYRNGTPIDGAYTANDDPWGVGRGGDVVTSATNPRGIKIGGSYPQNTVEMNPCDCQMDSLMFLDRVATQLEIDQQYQRMIDARP